MSYNFWDEENSSISKVILPLLLTEVTDTGKQRQLVALTNNFGLIYTPDQVKDLLQGLFDFYNSKDIVDWIENENKHRSLEILFRGELKKLSSGKYEIPKPKYKIKLFREDLLRSWSFECGWCGKRVSSETEQNYYIVRDDTVEISHERACSEDCASHIWYEGVNAWLNKSGFKDYFEK